MAASRMREKLLELKEFVDELEDNFFDKETHYDAYFVAKYNISLLPGLVEDCIKELDKPEVDYDGS